MPSNENQLIPKNEQESLLEILNRKYAPYLRGRFFEMKVWEDHGFVYVTIILSDRQQLFYYPIESRIANDENSLSKRDLALFLIDYIDFYLTEFFNDKEGTFLTIEWSLHTFEDVELQLRGQILSLEKERLADQWIENRGAIENSI